MKFNWKEVGTDVANIGLVTGGAIAANQFLDLQRIFKNADPNGWFIKHQGGVKVGAAAAALALFPKLPGWAKMLIIGAGVGGAIKEVKVSSGGKIESIGQGDGSGSDTDRLDRLLQEAAASAGTSGPYDQPGSGVGASTQSSVGEPPAIPNMDYGTTVGAVDFGRW